VRALCREASGTLPSGAIICPYPPGATALTAISANLIETASEGFDPADYPLYPVSVREQGGFIFHRAYRAAPSFDTTFERP